MIPLLALLPALLIADAATYDLSSRSEARVTSSVPGEAGSVNAQVLQLDLTGNAAFQLGAWTFSAGYSPHLLFFLPDQANITGVTGLNSAHLGATLTISPTQTLSVNQGATYGTQDNSPLNALPPGLTPAQQLLYLDPRLPLVEILATIAATSQATYTQRFSPFVTTTATAAFTVSGGTDAIAREFLPFQHTLSGGASLTDRLDKDDSLSLSVGGAGSNFTTGSRSRVVNASLGWSTLFARETTLTVSAGSSFSRSTGNTQASDWTPSAVGAVTLASVLVDGPERISYSLRGGVSTVVDPLGTGVFELGDARAGLTVEPSRFFSIAASAGGGRALTGGAQAGQTLVTADLNAALVLAPDVSLAIGARGSWQALPPGEIGAAGIQWAGYAALTLTDRGHF